MSYWKQVRPLVYLLLIIALAMRWAARPESWHWLLPPEGAAQAMVAQPSNENLQLSETPRIVPEDILKPIEDGTSGIKASERAALKFFLDRSQSITPDEVPSVNGITYLHLTNSPMRYRGKVVCLTGIVQKIEPVELAVADHEKRQVQQIWMTTPDSGANLLHVYAKNATGIKPNMNVELTGLFFKLQGYQSVNGPRISPVVIASEVTPLVTQERVGVDESLSNVSLIVGILGIVLFVICFWAYSRLGVSKRKKSSGEVVSDEEVQRAMAERMQQDGEEPNIDSSENH